MKLLELLEGLYKELRTFNENAEYFSLLENDKGRRREYPLKYLTDVEKINLKLWIKKLIQTKNITFVEDSYVWRYTKSFLCEDAGFATKTVRDYLCAALGFGSFEELLTAWRRDAQAEGRGERGMPA